MTQLRDIPLRWINLKNYWYLLKVSGELLRVEFVLDLLALKNLMNLLFASNPSSLRLPSPFSPFHWIFSHPWANIWWTEVEILAHGKVLTIKTSVSIPSSLSERTSIVRFCEFMIRTIVKSPTRIWLKACCFDRCTSFYDEKHIF